MDYLAVQAVYKQEPYPKSIGHGCRIDDLQTLNNDPAILTD
jgi:hypothetical protein